MSWWESRRNGPDTGSAPTAAPRDSDVHDLFENRPELLESVLEGSRLGFWVWHLETGAVKRSARWAEMLGYAPEEIAPTIDAWRELLHPDDRDDAQRANEEFAAGRNPELKSEYRLRAKDGTYRWIQDQAGVVRRDANGRPTRVSGSHADITERKLVEQALVEREARLAGLLASAIDAIVTIDERGVVESVNPAVERIFGYGAAELVGQNVSLLMPSPDCARHDDYLASYLAGGSSKIIGIGREVLGRRKDGSLVPVDLAVSELRVGEKRLFCGFLRDLTERQHAELEYRTILATAIDGFWIVDREGRFVEVNDSYCAMSGYGRNELLRMGIPDVEADEPPDEIRAQIENIARWGSARFERRHRRKDGTLFDVEVSARFVPLRGGAVVVFVQDVTERKRAERERGESSRRLELLVETRTASLARAVEEMKESRLAALNMMQDAVDARKRLEQANADLRREAAERQRAEAEKALIEEQLRQGQKIEAIGRLAGGIAHDFNNILGVVSGFTEMARETLAADHPARASLDEVLAAAKRATSLTRQLLAFSRKQVVRPKALDLDLLIGELERMLRPLLGETIELRLRPGEDLGTVLADPSQIQQVIVNLAINARDAMPGGGTLTIETANAEFAGEYAENHPPAVPGRFVMLAVSDTGSGMDEPTRARCFEPFFTTKPEGQGTGLGLSTVYGIVKQSGGYVWVYSEPNRGTTFKVYLPRVAELAAPLATVGTTPELATGTETVLLVEDTDGLRRMIRKMLEGVGYTVLDAADGEAALEAAAAHPGGVDLLLTDVVMPKLGGAELASRLAARQPGLRVLFMSGYTEGAISHQGVLSKGVALLEKPFSRQTLTRAVREALDRPPSR